MAISQSDTKWVKEKGKRGYVVNTKTGKRVTGKVDLVADTTKGKAGTTQTYKKGVGQGKKPAAPGKPAYAGGGQKPGKGAKPVVKTGGKTTSSPTTSAPTVTKPKAAAPGKAPSRNYPMKGRNKAANQPARRGDRGATSATVSGAVVRGKAKGPTKSAPEQAVNNIMGAAQGGLAVAGRGVNVIAQGIAGALPVRVTNTPSKAPRTEAKTINGIKYKRSFDGRRWGQWKRA